MLNKLQESDKFSWWNSLRHNGLMITPSKIMEYFSLEPSELSYDITERLRSHLNLLKSGETKILTDFVDFFIEKVLRLSKEHHYKENSSLSHYSIKSITGEIIRPDRVWKKDSSSAVLSVFIEPGSKNKDSFSRLGVGKSKRFISRVTEWLRKTNNKIAIATNGFQWRLIYAGADSDSWCESDISLWLEEGKPGLQIKAFRTLLSTATLLFGSDNKESVLLSAINASRQGQAELSDEIGESVRKAVELLIKESSEGIEQLYKQDPTITNREIYIAATRVIMRCVFILFAESRELLPRDNPIYHNSYGLQGLIEQLEKRSSGKPALRLKNSHSAWPRILALFLNLR